ncbi:flagellar hook-basal body complex protein FliE [Kineococcus sp. SYSU DK004]|uniref:flagellar hook-basal body complex protein FliE n=1 Tax=Kineococcus sp. SYSU DK004 TaxID=3383125 RepID=UPI003D7E509E
MSVETIGSVGGIGGVGGVGGALGTLATGFGQGIADTDNAQMTRAVTDGAATAVAPARAVGPQALPGAGGAQSGAGTGGDFAALLAGGLERLQGLQSSADQLAVRAATGDLTDVHDYMIASNEAQLATQLTTAIRNKAVEAFNEIMRMQI